MPNLTWSVVLAAGAGRRLADVTGGIPKQFWAPRGRATLLENTIERVRSLTPLSRTITVIDQSHHDLAGQIQRVRSIGHVAAQPMDRGTAAGVLLGISAMGSDPDAVVLLTPSDHGVENPAVFERGILAASRAVKAGRAGIVLFAVKPTSPTGDFGWVVPAQVADADLDHVAAFVEKPSADVARSLYRGGAAWNTMVMVARVGALLELYREHLPGLSEVFRAAAAMPTSRRKDFLADRYPDLARADFSRDLITPASGLHLHIWPESLGWTDLGTPDRLLAWLTAQRSPQQVAARPHAISQPAPAVA
jgi:mannose-1-phosphate guanylyltransferase